MRRHHALQNNFFARDTVMVAQDLLGKVIVANTPNGKVKVIITETEAYLGEEDKASHARFGITERNRVMHEKPGVWYVYLVYGMHWMLNAVAHPTAKAGAILMRGGIVLGKDGTHAVNGPGRVAKALGVDKSTNQTRVAPAGGMWIEERGITIAGITKGPRVGVGYAGAWARRPLRFMVSDGGKADIVDTVDNFA